MREFLKFYSGILAALGVVVILRLLLWLGILPSILEVK